MPTMGLADARMTSCIAVGTRNFQARHHNGLTSSLTEWMLSMQVSLCSSRTHTYAFAPSSSSSGEQSRSVGTSG